MERTTSDAAAVPLANTGEWCQAVLDDIEFLFRERYGAKWTPELQGVFQTLRSTVMEAASVVDKEFDAARALPLRRPVILSNGVRRA